jgi:hypothetical protein
MWSTKRHRRKPNCRHQLTNTGNRRPALYLHLDFCPSGSVALRIPLNRVVLDLERSIPRLLTRSQTSRDTLDDHIESSIIKKCTRIPVLLGEGAKDPMHRRFEPVVCPSFCPSLSDIIASAKDTKSPTHQIADVHDVSASQRGYSVPGSGRLVEDFKAPDCVRYQQDSYLDGIGERQTIILQQKG